MPNYSRKDPTVEQIPDGSTIDGGNFSQEFPDTPIMAGRTLTINRGNFTNVRKDPNWTINGGNFTQVSRCTNIDPQYKEKSSAPCGVDCQHVVSSEELIIDGVVIDIIYVYEDSYQ